MKRVIYVVVVLLSSLSAFGAAQLVLGLGLGAIAATLACIAAFVGNFFPSSLTKTSSVSDRCPPVELFLRVLDRPFVLGFHD